MGRVLFQIGRTKNQKRSQNIRAYINEIEVGWQEGEGQFLTTHKDRVQRNTIWFMYETFLHEEDVLRLEVTTFLTGIGKDEEFTFEALYCPSGDDVVSTVEMKNVGAKGYPLVKGKVQEIASVSDDDKRKQDIDDFLNKDF